MKRSHALLISLFAFLVFCCAKPDPDANLRNKFKEVKMGMALEQVINILGKPEKEINKMTGNVLTWNNDAGVERVEIKIMFDKVAYYKWKE